MIVELGAFALVLALMLSVAQTGLSAVGGARRSPVLAGAGQGAAIATFAALLVSFAALVYAFVTSDFSVANVATNSHTDKPMLFKVAGAWGSHEGSMLLWCLVLTGFGAAMAVFGDSLPPRLRAYAIAVQGALGVMFLAYTVFASNPLARLLDAPIQGKSLNPLLQDWALAFHPPFLYAGYVGFSVVYSLSMAALIEGRIDAAWARWVRPWTLAAWSMLTIGIALGAFWAYYELGWGGWWAWDPVENASFMPWLIGAALLHSAIVTEKRGALPGWTAFLALAAFTFSMLGAFLVRSGVLTSVHAFAVDPTRGVLLLIMMGVAAGAGFLLFGLRAPSLNRGGQFRPISRESAIVLNNILLSTATAVVLLGTLYPLIREAMDGEAVSVGAPFFNLTFTPLMLLAFAVLPAGPLLAWKRGDAKGVARKLWVVLAIAALLGLVAYGVVQPRKILASLGLVFGFWLVGGALLEMADRLKLFRAPAAESVRRARGLPRGAWGTTLAHAGLGVFVLGASFETSWRVEAAQALSLNDSQSLGAYTVTLKDVGTIEGPNYLAERGTVTVVNKAGQEVCRAEPERRFYPTGAQTTSEVAICAKGLDDIYIVLGERRAGEGGKPAWLVRAYVNPWVRLIFLGPLLMAIGGLVSLSDRRVRLGVGRRTGEVVS
ncbi:cytochrome c-type biogenesis protein CcmF [Caulobacter sp. BE264]|uniref:heme lyase CcmF/NrfE family subunit n=1 Tax=Caulobacter sp. BE264 TaxID=2817724 RepID=UPI0028600CA3|nr:heme lyase CcmF/NrfE family subunit [Caulobacter sp. BE264]MDR7232407.1 cytochrome c-type biogenesis protein CcmF [Caulobacter sp. BE264]